MLDGDNLHLISDIYQDLFEADKDNILVIGIVGAQGAGKSMLLRLLFGAQFASQEGRCTKGMYGAIMKIENHEKYKKLLILDTEGIMSTERNDILFDRKLMFYCLCITNIIIL